MPRSPGGGLANARQGRVAVAQEGQLLLAPRKGDKLGAALCFFSLSFSAACLISFGLGVSGPRCFEKNGDGAEGLLGALCRCRELEDAGGGGEPGGLRMLHGVFHGASQASLQGFRAPATSGHRLFLLRQDPRVGLGGAV